MLDVHRPARVGATTRRRLGRDDRSGSVENAELARGVLDIVADRGALDDRLVRRPGAERETQGEDVGVRPDARISEQVPGAADALRASRISQLLSLTAGLEAIGGVDAGNAGADDQDVEMLRYAESGTPNRSCSSASSTSTATMSPGGSARRRAAAPRRRYRARRPGERAVAPSPSTRSMMTSSVRPIFAWSLAAEIARSSPSRGRSALP